MSHTKFFFRVLGTGQSHLAAASIALASFLALSQPVAGQLNATESADIGLTQLRAENPGLTEGVGVKAHLVEAFNGGVDRYVPDPADAQLVNNSINLVGSPETATLSEITSGHSRTSARHFYGTSGVARDSGTGGLSIDVYAATPRENPGLNTPTADWINTIVFNGGRDPLLSEFDRSTVTSHSYVFPVDSTGQLPSIMERVDHIINERDTTMVVGTNNSGGLPAAWTPAYNVIAVGLSRGSHGRGLTTTYGSGRLAIDIVAPESVSSTGTPVVAGAVAILQDAADGSDAARSEVIRATLMAGATKGADDINGTWTRTSTQPLDLVFGAGELNIFNSYNIQQAGEFDGGSASPVSLLGFSGWDYEGNLQRNGQRLYEFEVPAGSQLENLSVVLAWNLDIVDSGFSSFFFSPRQELANLSLELLDSSGAVVDSSVSDVDNVEHVFQEVLDAGTYQLRVSNDNVFASDYGLAWRGDQVATTLLGDCDQDGDVDFADVPALVALLISRTFLAEADCDQDGDVDFSDVPVFVSILLNQ